MLCSIAPYMLYPTSGNYKYAPTSKARSRADKSSKQDILWEVTGEVDARVAYKHRHNDHNHRKPPALNS